MATVDLNSSMASTVKNTSAMLPPAPVYVDENRPPAAQNRDSEGSAVSALTEPRDRDSTGSATVVHGPIEV